MKLLKPLCLALLIALMTAAPARADSEYPLSKGGPVFDQTLAAPAGPIYQGPLSLPVVRSAPQRDHLYLFINGRRLFDDPGTVFGNTYNQTDWLTAQKARPGIWSWSLPGQVSRINIGESIFESIQKDTSLYLIAITQLGDGLLLLRRQINLLMPGFKESPTMKITEILDRFLAAEGVSVQSRLDGLFYLANKGRLSDQAFIAPIKLPVVETALDLSGGAAQKRQALIKLAVDQEKEMSGQVKALLARLIAGAGNEGR